jgi:peptidoglycan/LPS O-acetylase OafA/YrhL
LDNDTRRHAVTPRHVPATAEIRALTGLRGLAACMVLLYHFALQAVPWPPLHTVLLHGFLWVDCFFVLSGFVMALTFPVRAGGGLWRRQLDFLGRRIARIYPLYAVTTLIAFAVTQLGGGALPWARFRRPVSTLVANLLMLQNAAWLVPGGPHDWAVSANPAAWSISTEWLAYLFYPALALAIAARRRWVVTATALLAIATLFWLVSATVRLTAPPFAGADIWACRPGAAWRCPAQGLAPGGPLDVWDGNSPAVLRCFADFTLGLLAFRFRDHALAAALLRTRPASAIILILVFLGLSLHGADVFIVALFPLLIVSLLRADAPCARLLGGGAPYRLGVWSYSLYMVHEPLRVSAAYPWLAAHTPGPVAQALVSVCVLVPLSAATFVTVERPGRIWLRRVLLQERQRFFLEKEPKTYDS